MVKYMKKYRIYVFLLLFAGWLDVAGQKQVCEAAVLSEKTAVIMAASQVQEKDQGQDTAEELQTGAEDFLNIKAFHLQEVEESLADLEEESSFRFADALKSLIRGEIPLNLYRPGAWRVQEQVLGQGIFNLILEIPANLAGPGAAAPASQNAWQFRGKAQMQPVLLRPRLEPGQLIICNFLQGFPAQWAKHRHLVNAAQKLRGKMILQTVLDPVFPGTGQESQALSLPPAST